MEVKRIESLVSRYDRKELKRLKAAVTKAIDVLESGTEPVSQGVEVEERRIVDFLNRRLRLLDYIGTMHRWVEKEQSKPEPEDDELRAAFEELSTMTRPLAGTETQEHVIELVLHEGLTIRQAADKLGLSRTHVGRTLERVLNKLRHWHFERERAAGRMCIPEEPVEVVSPSSQG